MVTEIKASGRETTDHKLGVKDEGVKVKKLGNFVTKSEISRY